MTRLYAALNKVNEALRKVEIYTGAVFVGFIFLMTSTNIILRYFFNSPVAWAEEVILIAFTFLGFLTGAYALSKDELVRFTSLLDKIPQKARAVVLTVHDIMIIAVLIILLPSAMRNFRFLTITPALGIPKGFVYFITPLTYALMSFHLIVNIFTRFVVKEEGEA